MRDRVKVAAVVVSLGVLAVLPAGAAPPAGEGWAPLFNGKDLSGWKVPKNNNGHWKAVDNLIDYDARGGDSLWTEKSFGDFVLHIEWRLKTAKEIYGSEKDQDGKPFAYAPDSGIYLRGTPKAQTNIWTNPMGSGEVWGYRTDPKMPEGIRKACTPKLRADKPLGEWNVQEVAMKGDHLTVVLNGKTVIDTQLPGVPANGPIALQHHGGFNPKTQRWSAASSCIQFRDIYVKELK